MKRLLLSILTCSLLLIGFFGCENEITPSLYDPNHPQGSQPVIDSISPAGSALAAAQPLTIYGKNFSTTAGVNRIFFNGKPGTVVSATATQLVVTSSADSGSVTVLVSTTAEDYSAGFPYKLILAVDPFGNFTPPATGATALTPDSASNLYFNQLASGGDNGIAKLAPNGTKTNFALKTTGTSYWTSLRIGPGKNLYAVKGAKAIYQFTAAGGTQALLWKGVNTSKNTFSDIDFDQNKNLWASGSGTGTGGAGDGLYCFKQDKTFKFSTYTSSIRSVRVFNGYLYFSALKDSSEKILRAVINTDTLGTVEEYFDISASVGKGYIGQSITFSSDGYLYIGTQAPLGIIVVAPDKSATTPYSAYAGLFGTQINSVAWGPGDVLYVSTSEGNLLKVRTLKSGAPYHGLN